MVNMKKRLQVLSKYQVLDGFDIISILGCLPALQMACEIYENHKEEAMCFSTFSKNLQWSRS